MQNYKNVYNYIAFRIRSESDRSILKQMLYSCFRLIVPYHQYILTRVLLNANSGIGKGAARKVMESTVEKSESVGVWACCGRPFQSFPYCSILSNHCHLERNERYVWNQRSTCYCTGVEPLLRASAFSIAVPTDWSFLWCANQVTSTIRRGKIETRTRMNKELI